MAAACAAEAAGVRAEEENAAEPDETAMSCSANQWLRSGEPAEGRASRMISADAECEACFRQEVEAGGGNSTSIARCSVGLGEGFAGQKRDVGIVPVGLISAGCCEL